MKNYTYATFLSNKDYLPGLKVLASSLFKTKPNYPFVVVIPEDCDSSLEREIHTICLHVSVVKMPNIIVNTTSVDEKTSH